MSIDRDEREERQARVDGMIREFRDAQSRRIAKRSEPVVESQLDAGRKAVPSAASPRAPADLRHLPRLDYTR